MPGWGGCGGGSGERLAGPRPAASSWYINATSSSHQIPAAYNKHCCHSRGEAGKGNCSQKEGSCSWQGGELQLAGRGAVAGRAGAVAGKEGVVAGKEGSCS